MDVETSKFDHPWSYKDLEAGDVIFSNHGTKHWFVVCVEHSLSQETIRIWQLTKQGKLVCSIHSLSPAFNKGYTLVKYK